MVGVTLGRAEASGNEGGGLEACEGKGQGLGVLFSMVWMRPVHLSFLASMVWMKPGHFSFLMLYSR